jgi:hypothetical protein
MNSGRPGRRADLRQSQMDLVVPTKALVPCSPALQSTTVTLQNASARPRRVPNGRPLAKQHVEQTIQLQSTNLRACQTGSTLCSRRGSPPLRDCWAEGRGTTPRRPFPPLSLVLTPHNTRRRRAIPYPMRCLPRVWSPAYVFPFREATMVVGLLQGRRSLGEATHRTTAAAAPHPRAFTRAPPPLAPRRLLLPLSRSASHMTRAARARTNRRTRTG